MIRFILKEVSLLFAFVVLGGLVLICLWLTKSVDDMIVREFEHSQVTVVIKEGGEDDFRSFLDKSKDVVRYEVQGSESNRNRLMKGYPELRTVLEPLGEDYFPVSASITVVRLPEFLESLQAMKALIDRQIVHRPPEDLAAFMRLLTFVFSVLWLLTLGLVLYFNIERVTVAEEKKWSLLKMLGQKPHKVFYPLWRGQLLRVGIASAIAILVAVGISNQIEAYFAWKWSAWAAWQWLGFLVIAALMTTLISMSLFYYRFKRVSLG